MSGADDLQKGFLGAVPAVGGALFGDTLSFPLMTLRASALDHNLAQLAGFCADHGLLHAPHGKTTMAPALWQRQLDAGAWAITLATPDQVLVGRHFGFDRLLLANEVLDANALRVLAADQAAHDAFELLFFVDSSAGVRAAAAAAVDAHTEFTVLIDLGYDGGRTGCRGIPAAVELAAAIAATRGVRLAGVAGYEGGLPDTATVTDYLRDLRDLAQTLYTEGLAAADAIVTAGGSSYFDSVAEVFSSDWADGFAPRVVLRSGAYVSHDDGVYRRKTPYNRMPGELAAAIEVFAQVISPGDPGRVIVGMGKRDAPYDDGLPVPLRVRRAGTDSDEPLDGTVEKMDDQHAYLRTDAALEPGDVVSFGISHPCTAFDKWRLLPIVDDDGVVIEVVRTYF